MCKFAPTLKQFLMMKKITFYLVVAFMLVNVISFAQGTITGTINDADLGGPLSGANVVEDGTTNGAISDFDGKFSLTVDGESGKVTISYLGYHSTTVSYTLSNGSANLGTVSMAPDADALAEVVVIGKGIIDLAGGRKTPVAVSTIKASEIQAKAGNSDLPELLKSTPSVQSVQAGGFGDGQMFLRGFDQTNTAFLLNGQPINGMEDGKMYWSNWSGVLDVADAVQVQRGLGASKLAISSVGGTVNIVTKTIDKREHGFVQQMFGNDNYLKSTAYYSTGVNEKGWSFSGLFGYWQGDGYVDFTAGQGQTYFLSFGYQPNDKHAFNFLLTGAPQWHAAAGRGKISDFIENGRRYNSWIETGVDSPNTIKKGVYPGGRNIYHKPVANLSWDWDINEKSSLSSVIYGSLGRGAFAVEKITDGTGYARGSFNNHNWFGLVTNYNNELSENLNLNIGADVRTYNGIHFRGVNEFFGGMTSLDNSSEFSGDYTITETYGGIDPWGMVFNPNTEHDQRLGYDYEEVITYYGVFGQLEYSNDALSAFFQGALSNQDHLKTDYYNYETAEESEKVSNVGYNVKAGASYNIGEIHQIFGNAGYYSRQPFHDDLFDQVRNSNALIDPAVENQDITGFEVGYKLGTQKVKANFNAYHTTWANRTIPGNNGENFESDEYRGFQTSGVKQVHMGLELEVMTQFYDNLRFSGFISVGDWQFVDNAIQRTFDNDGVEVEESVEVEIDGFKVGGAAQVTGGLSAWYEILPRFSVDSNWNLYNDMHSQGSLTKTPLSLPSFDTVDAGLSYKMLVGDEKQNSIQFRLNVNNIFSEVYLESVFGNTQASLVESENYKGVNTSNNGRFGYGRTWNVSLRFNF